jgi:hypothetical protein
MKLTILYVVVVGAFLWWLKAVKQLTRTTAASPRWPRSALLHRVSMPLSPAGGCQPLVLICQLNCRGQSLPADMMRREFISCLLVGRI